jgi:hypothetical protein
LRRCKLKIVTRDRNVCGPRTRSPGHRHRRDARLCSDCRRECQLLVTGSRRRTKVHSGLPQKTIVGAESVSGVCLTNVSKAGAPRRARSWHTYHNDECPGLRGWEPEARASQSWPAKWVAAHESRCLLLLTMLTHGLIEGHSNKEERGCESRVFRLCPCRANGLPSETPARELVIARPLCSDGMRAAFAAGGFWHA